MNSSWTTNDLCGRMDDACDKGVAALCYTYLNL